MTAGSSPTGQARRAWVSTLVHAEPALCRAFCGRHRRVMVVTGGERFANGLEGARSPRPHVRAHLGERGAAKWYATTIRREMIERIVAVVRRAPSAERGLARGRHRRRYAPRARLAGEDEYVAMGTSRGSRGPRPSLSPACAEEARARQADKLATARRSSPRPYWYWTQARLFMPRAALDEGLAAGVYGVLPAQAPVVKELLGVPEDVHFVCLVTIGRRDLRRARAADLPPFAAPAAARRGTGSAGGGRGRGSVGRPPGEELRSRARGPCLPDRAARRLAPRLRRARSE